VLAAPDFSKPWIILTDCSDYAMGACLAQLDENGIERPMAYASANLSEAQKNYGITDKEGLAVVWAVRKWRHFLHGSSAVVATDHSCLKDLTSGKEFDDDYNLFKEKLIARIPKTSTLLGNIPLVVKNSTVRD
jgi:hypothetical protein